MPNQGPLPMLCAEAGGPRDSEEVRLVGSGTNPGPHGLEIGAPPPLRAGDTIADRFVIERLAGHGGMGAVYRALDRVTGTQVALKVMGRGGLEQERFAQEARVLSQLTHPAVVRYVAHGHTPHGEPFLAMEWLEGYDLASRLSRAGLSVAESLALTRRVAEGLSVAHARGVVHRDVKPSNVFLVGDDPARTKLLDFGIVRLPSGSYAQTAAPMTRTGMVLGTVGYMSPEQAIADRALDARADIFALGCVLFECLTGEHAFSGAHVAAVLAKVLREEAPRLRKFRPDLPVALDELVARMLSKDKAGRPSDGAALVEELQALGNIAGGVPEAWGQVSSGLSGGERRLACVMLALISGEPERVGDIVKRHGGDQARLANGALLVTLSGRGATSVQVVTAAACALELYEAFPAARIALATGSAPTSGSGSPGAVIDQAAALLAQSLTAGIRIDEVTTGLLGERFDVRAEGDAQVLMGRRSDAEQPRTLLGKPTPCVGRDRELGILELTLRESISESLARVVLVTGPPGQGKSRLRHEFVTRARARGDVSVLTAHADPVSAGSAFMLVRQLIRQAAGLREGDPAREQHAKLRAHLAEIGKGVDSARTADFLGELIGAPSEGSSPELRAAQNDPQLMAESLRRSFGQWLSAQCGARPLLLVLEDLHWGDLPSVAYLADGLRDLPDRPLMVLALARPEVTDTFPNLWAGTERQDLALGRLGPRAAERLVRGALGDDVDAAAVSRIVERADGNAFYIEELVRVVAEGDDDALPKTVLALVQFRLERLEPDARRIARAASIFGEVFWRGGVASLLGALGQEDLDAWLLALVEREVIAVAPSSRFPDEREYAFRHGLMREAAYTMLTDVDRKTGHGLACAWLEKAGETNASVLALHSEEGGAYDAAAMHHMRAGDYATRLCSYDEARRHYNAARAALAKLPEDDATRRGQVDNLLKLIFISLVADMADVNFQRAAEARALLEKIAEGEELSAEDKLRLARVDYFCGRIHFYRSETHKAIEYYRKVLAVGHESGNDELIGLPSCLIGTATLIQGYAREAEPILAQSIGPIERQGEPFEWFRAVGYHAVSLTLLGRCQESQTQLDRIVARAHEVQKPNLLAATCIMTGTTHLLAGDWPRALSFLTRARAHAMQTGDKLHQNLAYSGLGWASSFVGRHEEARAHRVEAKRIASAMGGRLMLDDWYRAGDAEIAFNGGELDLAFDLAKEVAKTSETDGLPLSHGIAERVMGDVLAARGRREEADERMRRSLAVFARGGLNMLAARTTLAWALQLRSVDDAEADRLYREATGHYRDFGSSYALDEATKRWSGRSP